jgi:hypothetical protein
MTGSPRGRSEVLAHPLIEVVKIAAGFTSEPTDAQLVLTGVSAPIITSSPGLDPLLR